MSGLKLCRQISLYEFIQLTNVTVAGLIFCLACTVRHAAATTIHCNGNQVQELARHAQIYIRFLFVSTYMYIVRCIECYRSLLYVFVMLSCKWTRHFFRFFLTTIFFLLRRIVHVRPIIWFTLLK